MSTQTTIVWCAPFQSCENHFCPQARHSVPMRRGTSSTKSSTSRAISLIFVDRQDDLSCKGTEVDVFAGIVLTLYAVKAIFSKRSESQRQSPENKKRHKF
jgi:hypothetical protein